MRKSLIAISLAAAVAASSLAIDQGLAEAAAGNGQSPQPNRRMNNAATAQKKALLSTKNPNRMTREDMARSSREKAKVRRDIIRAHKAGERHPLQQ